MGGKNLLPVTALRSLATASEEYQLHDHMFYLHAPNGIGRSKLVSYIEACLGVSVTERNLNTILKLEEMVQNQRR